MWDPPPAPTGSSVPCSWGSSPGSTGVGSQPRSLCQVPEKPWDPLWGWGPLCGVGGTGPAGLAPLQNLSPHPLQCAGRPSLFLSSTLTSQAS